MSLGVEPILPTAITNLNNKLLRPEASESQPGRLDRKKSEGDRWENDFNRDPADLIF